MLKLYTEKQAKGIITRLQENLAAIRRDYAVPEACMQAVLHMEITRMNWLDRAADAAVAMHGALYRALRFLRIPADCFRLPGKKDSSTGYAQIFAAVAIRAICFGMDHGFADASSLGLSAHQMLDSGNADDLMYIWKRLHRETDFNLRCAALNVLCAAQEMTGRTDLASFSPEEWRLTFTRYNANTRTVTAYGREAYKLYAQYRQNEAPDAPAASRQQAV